MSDQIDWAMYTASQTAAANARAKIAAIGMKANPSQEELDSLRGLAEEADKADEYLKIAEAMLRRR